MKATFTKPTATNSEEERATVKTCVKYYDMKVPSIDEFQLGALNILEGARVKFDLEQSFFLL